VSTIAVLTTRFDADTQEFRNGVADVERSTGLAGRTMQGVGRVAASLFVAGAGAAATFAGAVVASGVSYNVLYQKSSAAFKSILGSGEAANKMMSELAEFAKTSPFPRQAFIEATQQMLAFGYSAKDVVPTLDAIQNAVAATGGSAEQIGEIANVLSKVQSTGKFTAQTLNELGYRGIDAAKLIGQGMNQTAQQVRESITKGTLDSKQALRVLTEQMAVTYKGAAEGVKNTWVGATDRVRGAMRDIGSAIVEPFISKTGGGLALDWANKFADLLRALEPLVTPLVNAVANKLGPALQGVTGFLDKLIAKVKEFGAGGAGDAVSSLSGAFSSMLPILAPVAGLLLKVGGANLAGLFGPLAGLVSGVTGALGPFTMGLAAVVATSPQARAGLGQIGQSLGGLLGPIMGVVRALGDALGPVIAAVVPGVVALVKALVDAIKGMLPAIKEVIPSLGEIAAALGQALSEALRAVAPLLPAFAEGVKVLAPFLTAAAKAIAGLLKAMGPVPAVILIVVGALWLLAAHPVVATIAAVVIGIGLLYKVFGPVPLVILAVVAAMWLLTAVPVVAIIVAIIAAVAALVAGIILLVKNWDTVWNAIKDVAVAVWNAIKVAWDAAWGAIQTGFQAVLGFLTALPGRILGVLSGASSWLLNTGRDLIQGLLNGITSAATAVWGWLTALPARILGLLASAASWLLATGRSIINGLRNGITAAASAVWSFFSSLPGRILGLLSGAASWLLSTGRAVISGMLHGIEAAAGALWSFMRSIPGRIISAVGNAGSWLVGVGRQMIQGLISGVSSMAGSLVSKVVGVVKAPIDAAKKLLKIGSPSKVWAGLGVDVGAGLELGLARGADAVAAVAGQLARAAMPGGLGAPAVAGASAQGAAGGAALPSWQSMFAGGGTSGAASSAGRQAPAVNIEHYEVKEDADHRRIFDMARFEERAGRI
jgi:tape measure domain-containing protein